MRTGEHDAQTPLQLPPWQGGGLLNVGIALAMVLLVSWLAARWYGDVLGLTYDEPVYAAVADRHLGWYERLLHGDFSALSRDGLAEHWGNAGDTPVEADWHPPVGKLLQALGRHLPVPAGIFGHWRYGSSLLYALTAAILFLWLTPTHGRAAGLSAAAVWLTLPRVAAHGNLNALDGPVACLSTLALWQGWRLLQRPTLGQGALFGVALAVATATKFNGVLVFPPVLLMVLLVRRDALKPLLLGSLLVAPLVFWLLWPWLWYDGLLHLKQVIAFHGKHGYIATEYLGRIWTDPPPPWHFAIVMLLITSPPTLVAAACCAAWRDERPRSLPALLALAAAVHLAPFLLPAAAKYNGVRLFLPVFPLLAALAGIGLSRVGRAAAGKLPEARRWAAPAIATVVVCWPGMMGLLAVYPYPMAYYNALVGGPAGADAKGFELSYWGDPFRESCLWLSQPGRVPEDGAVAVYPPGAIAMVRMYQGAGILRTDIRLVADFAAADYVMVQNRRSEWNDDVRQLLARPPAAVIEADGAPVGFIAQP